MKRRKHSLHQSPDPEADDLEVESWTVSDFGDLVPTLSEWADPEGAWASLFADLPRDYVIEPY